MGKKFLAFFTEILHSIFQVEIPKPVVQPVIELDTKLMTQVDSKRLDDMEKVLAILTVNIHRLVEEEKKTQEYMVHLSTLHEELLNQLDQGNIAMVKVRQQSSEDEDYMGLEDPDVEKKKSELN